MPEMNLPAVNTAAESQTVFNFISNMLRKTADDLDAGEVAQVVLVVKRGPGDYTLAHFLPPLDQGSQYRPRSSSGTALAVENLLHGFEPAAEALRWPEGANPPRRLPKVMG